MKKRELSEEFIKTINKTIKTANIKKSAIADDIGVNRSTMTRIFSGENGVNKPIAKSIIRSINSLAGQPILDERATLELAGFSKTEKSALSFELGEGAELMLDEKYSQKEQKEIVDTMKIAFEIAVRKLGHKHT